MPNRTVCDVLSEMRTCYKTRNFSYLQSLIEELQTMANRMEAKLWDQKEFEHREKEYRKQKQELKYKDSSTFSVEEYEKLKIKCEKFREALESVASFDNDDFIDGEILMYYERDDLVDTLVEDTIIVREVLEEYSE